jgi:hypothetical protein
MGKRAAQVVYHSIARSLKMPDQESIPLDDEEPISLEPQAGPAPPPPPKQQEAKAPAKDEDDEEPITLVEEGETGATAMRTFGTAAAVARKSQFKRTLNVTGTGATRCRIFHSKIAIAPLEHLEGDINDWLDSEEIEVKQVGHIIGTMEGKRPEPNLLVIVWY